MCRIKLRQRKGVTLCWWHQLTIGTYREWTEAWLNQREADTHGYAAEQHEHDQAKPCPRFADVLTTLAQQ